MKVIRKNQTHKFKNSEKCLAIEYPLADKDINGAVIKLNGRYPDKGQVVNMICKELAYVISGNGKICAGKKEVKIRAGDLVLLKPGEKYYWKGKLTMFVPCAPAWYPEQHKEVGDD